LTSYTIFLSKLNAFFLGTSFASLQTWDILLSYAHLNHICGKHTHYSFDPFEDD
jgi:hypothetical protein